MFTFVTDTPTNEPWNKGRLIGQKRPLKLQEIWGIRIRLQLEENLRELALFNLAIDSKLRGCDLLKLRVSDVMQAGRVRSRTQIILQKTQQPVQFEITEQTRGSLNDWISEAHLASSDYLFPTRIRGSTHLSTRQYSRIVDKWVTQIGLDPTLYGTHTIDATNEGVAYLSSDEEFESHSIVAWAYETRKHC